MKILYKTLLFTAVFMAGFLILNTSAQSKQKVKYIRSVAPACQATSFSYHQNQQILSIVKMPVVELIVVFLLHIYRVACRCPRKYKTSWI